MLVRYHKPIHGYSAIHRRENGVHAGRQCMCIKHNFALASDSVLRFDSVAKDIVQGQTPFDIICWQLDIYLGVGGVGVNVQEWLQVRFRNT